MSVYGLEIKVYGLTFVYPLIRVYGVGVKVYELRIQSVEKALL